MGDMLSKVAGGQEKHGAFPGYYLLLVMLTLFPGSILLFPSARRIVELRREPMAMFLIAWVVPSWLVFELLPTKLPHYVLPMYPALALAIGYYVAERMSGFGEAAPRWARLVNIVWWALMVLAVAGIMLAAPYLYGDGIGFMDVILACAVLAAAGIFATITFSQTWRLFVPAAAVLAAITYAGLFEVTFARVPALHVSPRLAGDCRHRLS
jgi:4-amino-4-deoxy-L-arabinose transferase-like glycosyltransferase